MTAKLKAFLPKDSADYPAFFFMNASFISIALYELIHVSVPENI